MEKTEDSTVQFKIIPETSTLKFLACVGFGMMLCLLAALVVFSMLIYGNTKDIKMAHMHDREEIFRNYQPSRMNPKFEGFYQQHDKVDRDLTFHIVKTGEMNTENIVVIGHEEIITTPGARIIFDFSRGWMVTKVTTSGANTCYVSKFNMTESIESVRECLLKDMMIVFITGDETRIQYRRTEELVDRSSLSPNAAIMCEDSNLIWFVEVNGDDNHVMVKRGDGRGSWAQLVGMPDGKARRIAYEN